MVYLVFWLRDDAPSGDKVKIRDKYYAVFNDRSKINMDLLPQWRVIANTNITGRLLVVAEANLWMLNVNSNNVTKTAFDNWKAANLAQPGYFRVERGSDWRTIAANAGLEIVPE